MNNLNSSNSMINSKLMELLSTIDKEKLNDVSKMVQNMSKDDLNNLVGLLNKNSNKSGK